MSKGFLTVVEAIDELDDLSDHEDTELVVLPPENKDDVTDEENDDENLRETRVIEEVAGEVEVLYRAWKATNSKQIQLPQKTKNVEKLKKFDEKIQKIGKRFF